MEVKNIFVVGAGQMGSGIAQVAAQSGFKVMMMDVEQALVQRALDEIKSRWQRQVERGKIDESAKADMLKRLVITTDLSMARDADVVIEAAPEKMDLKQRILAQLDGICPQHTIFASNTTAIPITKLASATKRPDRVIGMHFTLPVPVITLLEMVRGYLTSDETFATAMKLARDMGREPITTAKDYAGFGQTSYLKIHNVATRGAAETINRDLYALYEGSATVEDITSVAFVAGMNTLAWLDMVGLDTMLNVLNILYEEYGHPKFFPCPLLKRMVEAGHLGQKTGIGFYDYSKTPRKATELSPWFFRFISREEEEVGSPLLGRESIQK